MFKINKIRMKTNLNSEIKPLKIIFIMKHRYKNKELKNKCSQEEKTNFIQPTATKEEILTSEEISEQNRTFSYENHK